MAALSPSFNLEEFLSGRYAPVRDSRTEIISPNQDNNEQSQNTVAQPSPLSEQMRSHFPNLRRRLGPTGWTVGVIVGLIALAMALLLSLDRHSTGSITEDATDYQIKEADCLWVLSSVDTLDRFPLPYPIDRDPHASVLKELQRPYLLQHLANARSALCSTPAITVEELVGYIATGAKAYSHFPSEETITTIRSNINSIDERLYQAGCELKRLKIVVLSTPATVLALRVRRMGDRTRSCRNQWDAKYRS